MVISQHVLVQQLTAQSSRYALPFGADIPTRPQGVKGQRVQASHETLYTSTVGARRGRGTRPARALARAASRRHF